jgi:hypothetical protein
MDQASGSAARFCVVPQDEFEPGELDGYGVERLP